jgi:fumarate reductase flavoprotein subunit
LQTLKPFTSFESANSWPGFGPSLTLALLQQRLTAQGGEVAFETSAVELLQSRDDRSVTGLVVRDGSGRARAVDARAIVLADGGFAANRALVRACVGPFADQGVLRGAPGGTGDSLRMAEALGAASVNTQYVYGHLLHREALENDRLWPQPILDGLAIAGMIVTGRGERFSDESLGGVAIANEVARLQSPRDTWVVVDDEMWSTSATGPGGLLPESVGETLAARGATVLQSDTIAGLASDSGIRAAGLVETIDEYNRAVEAEQGFELRVERGGRPKPLRQPPFRAIPSVHGITFTMGGLRIDEGTRVLDLDGRTIPGLYAAGAAAGGLQGGGTGYVGGLVAALTQGYIAGRSAASG